MDSLGTKLKQLRIENNISAEQAAKSIGVSRSAIYFWENNSNEPKANYLHKLAELYNVPTDYLLEDEELKVKKKDTHTIQTIARSKNTTVKKHIIELTDEQYQVLLEIIEQNKENNNVGIDNEDFEYTDGTHSVKHTRRK